MITLCCLVDFFEDDFEARFHRPTGTDLRCVNLRLHGGLHGEELLQRFCLGHVVRLHCHLFSTTLGGNVFGHSWWYVGPQVGSGGHRDRHVMRYGWTRLTSNTSTLGRWQYHRLFWHWSLVLPPIVARALHRWWNWSCCNLHLRGCGRSVHGSLCRLHLNHCQLGLHVGKDCSLELPVSLWRARDVGLWMALAFHCGSHSWCGQCVGALVSPQGVRSFWRRACSSWSERQWEWSGHVSWEAPRPKVHQTTIEGVCLHPLFGSAHWSWGCNLLCSIPVRWIGMGEFLSEETRCSPQRVDDGRNMCKAFSDDTGSSSWVVGWYVWHSLPYTCRRHDSDCCWFATLYGLVSWSSKCSKPFCHLYNWI